MAETSETDMGKRRTLLLGSEMEYDFACHPCETAGRNTEAMGYCLNCRVYLCGACMKYHKVLPAVANHQLVDKGNIPQEPATPEIQEDKGNIPQEPATPEVQDACTERCKIHRDEIIKYYCSTHSVLGCSACITLKRIACKDVAYILEIVPGLEDSSNFKEFKAKLEDLKQKSKDAIKKGQESVQRSTENYTKVQEEIEDHRREINEALDKLNDELKEKLSKIKTQETETLNSIEVKANQALTELESISSDIDAHLSKKQLCQLFIQMKTTEKKLMELQETMEELKDTRNSDITFKPNVELKKLLKRQDSFGYLITENPKNANARYVKNIDVKSKNNTKTCRITGMAQLSSDLLVMADNQNASIKLVDTNTNAILCEAMLDALPWDVTTLDSENVAVTVPESKKILFFRYDDQKLLTFRKEICFKAECWGIDSTSNKILVAFSDPEEVRILSMDANELKKIVKDDQGRKLFKSTQHVAVNAFNQSICVSDWKQDSVIMLDMNGKVKDIYKDKKLIVPKQLAVDHTGRMYLSGKSSHNIHVVSPDCKKQKLLLKRSDGIDNPESVCFCEETGQLYIGARHNNSVKVYKLV